MQSGQPNMVSVFVEAYEGTVVLAVKVLMHMQVTWLQQLEGFLSMSLRHTTYCLVCKFTHSQCCIPLDRWLTQGIQQPWCRGQDAT